MAWSIGPGKPLDTVEHYLTSSDTLVNLVANDPNVITTGPATLNPDTGEPWGMDFPVVTIRDFVEVQHALLESQGIESLHAVMGASMGALQAIKQTLDDIAAARAALSDANHLLYLVRANQTFMAGYGDSLEAGLAAMAW